MNASPLLQQYLGELRQASPVLDLACGSGRNGLYLLRQQVPVVFADRNPAALDTVRKCLQEPPYSTAASLAELWQLDLEQSGTHPLGDRSFGTILVFRYLHRPLFPAIRKALQPGGLLVYETFTRGQARLGRPTNPDFLLREGELEKSFADWDILHSFEGIVQASQNNSQSAIAQLVARKPDAVS